MLKKGLAALAILGIGVYLGYQMPRGAALVSTLAGLGGPGASADYSGLASHQALLDFQDTFDQARQMVLTDARTEQEAIVSVLAK